MKNRNAVEAARIAATLEKHEKREADDAEPPLKLSFHLLGCFLIGLFVGLFLQIGLFSGLFCRLKLSMNLLGCFLRSTTPQNRCIARSKMRCASK